MNARAAVVGLASLAGCALTVPRAEAQNGAYRDFADMHREAYIRERAYPFDSIPAGAMDRALQSVRGLRGTPPAGMIAGGVNAAVLPGASGWRAVGPSPIAPTYTFYNGRGPNSGRVNAIAVDPRNSSTVYVGTAGGGVWKSTNGGVSWVPLTDNQCALAINAITLDPVNPDIVYAGTGDHGNGTAANCGVLRSTDGGSTWTTLFQAAFTGTSSGGVSIEDIVVDPSTAGTANPTLIITSTGGTVRSTNSVSFAVASSAHLENLALGAADGSVLYAGTVYWDANPGVYKSTDHGVTFTRVLTTPSRVRVATAPSAPSTVYAASCAANVNALEAVRRSTDAGVTWTVMNGTIGSDFTGQCWYDLHIEVDPSNPDHIFLGGISLYASVDGGRTFAHVGDHQVHSDQQSLAFDPQSPNVVYAGSDGGIFRSMDGGATWTSLSGTLGTALFTRGIAINPVNPSQLLAGTQDNGSIEANGTSIWNEVSSGDGGYGAYDVNTGTTAFTEYVWGQPQNAGPKRRIGTDAWTFARTGILTSDRAPFYPALVMDPARGRMLYFGTYRVYRTANAGDLWTPISGDLSRGTGTVTAIAAAATDSNTVYAGTSDGQIQATHNLGTSWSLGTGLPNRHVTAIVVDTTNAQVAFATVSGFGTGHVWKTADGGTTWLSVSGNLPDAPANDIVYQSASHELDVATDVGLFRSTDGGVTWTLFDGLPNVVMMALAYHGPSRTLVVGTYGRGMFAYQYGATTALRGDVDGDGAVTAADALAVLNAVIGRAPVPGQKIWPNGDANCDGTTSVLDAQVILSFVVGLPLGAGCVNVTR